MKKTSVKDITKFREAIKNVVSMLVARNIPVIERGDKAYVEYNKAGEPLCICIPSIPDDASDKFLMAIRGFIDHEVAHVLFTDSTKATSFVWNAVEDTFIERKMGEMFKGSRANLINTQKHVIDTVFIPKEMEAIAEKLGDQTRMFMEFYLVPVLRAWNDQTPFIDYMEDRWESVKEPVSILIKHGVDKMIPKISSTSDSVAVAALIVRLLVDKPMESKEPDGSDS
ncbi:MAG: cobalamin biosynthesis protein CobT, partial [Citrobacter freundii]|nr:cobalamin biosynthesis protein CobT [Citrobacter freundii]